MKRARVSCATKKGHLKKICILQVKKLSKTIHTNMLKFCIGRCKYTRNEEECKNNIKYELLRLDSELKNLDDSIHKRQQNIK